nr:CHAT domain-containing protein [Salsipaludibacter albus]
MFEALFRGDVERALRESQIHGDHDERGVRIRLRLHDAPELAALPWEYLYDPVGARPLAISTQTPVVRYVDLGNPVRTLRVAPPLRILAVMSSPRNVEALDTTREFHDLKASLRDQVAAGRVEVHGLHRATPSRLRDQLGTEAFHIVHFMGHGAFDEATGTGMVLLEDDDGDPHPISGHDLGLVLHDHDDLRMVVLNACEGGRGSETDPVGGVAQSMVHHDIPAVVGMQAEITDVAATSFSEAFYRHLGQGTPVDVAMSEARMKLLLDGHGAEWGIPILYLRSQDGRIFDLVDEPAPADVAALEERADRLQEEGHEAGKIHAAGLYERVVGLAPDHDVAAGKLAALQRDIALVPEAGVPVAPTRHPLPPPAPSIRPVPTVPGPSPTAPVTPPERADWVPTPVRASRMLARTAMMLEQASVLLGEQDRKSVSALVRALHEPLRIAVAGRVHSGKSTLVNALLGDRVAPTAARAGSQVVTWYRHGPARASLLLHDGEVRSVDLVDGQVPAELPVPSDQVDRLDVWLPTPALRRQTIIDTPGLPSLTPMGSTSRRLLLGRSTGSGGEMIAADAVLYVFRGVPTRDELAFLGAHLDGLGVLAASAVNAIGVFSHADMAADGPWGERDPLEEAHRAADSLEERAPQRAAAIVAVSGMMAEAARTGVVREADAHLLSRLAAVPRDRVEAWPREGVDDVPASVLEDVVGRCGPYVLAHGRGEAHAGATALMAWMDRRSGVPALEDAIRDRLLARSTALKADHALAELTRIAHEREGIDPQVAGEVNALVEQARLHGDLRPIRELEALRGVSGVDRDLHDALLLVSGSGSIHERLGLDPVDAPDDVVSVAQHAAAEAQRAIGLATDPRARAAARVLSTSYRLLADEARALQA